MIQELLSLVRNTSFEKLLEPYTLYNGEFFLIDLEGNIISENKKEKEEAPWETTFKNKCFLSEIINTNKSVLKKGIQTSNIYAFVTWQDKYLDLSNIYNLIDEYYDNLKKLGNDEEKINICKTAIKKATKHIHEHIHDYFKIIDNKTGEVKYNMPQNRICIFIDVSDDEYNESFKKYLQKNLFLDDSYNILLNEITCGVPSNNNTYNKKKIFMKHLTQPNVIHYQCDFETCYDIYKLYNWLLNVNKLCHGTIKIKADTDTLQLETNENADKYYLLSGEIQRTLLGPEFIVTDFQFISLPENDILGIVGENFLSLEGITIPSFSNWKDLQTFIEKDMFSWNLYKNPSDIKLNDNTSSMLAAHYIQYQTPYKLAIKYKDMSLLNGIWEKSITDFIFDFAKIGIKGNEGLMYTKICQLLTVKYIILDSGIIKEGGKTMKSNLIEIQNSIREKINNKQITPQAANMDEYCFAVGQLTKYLISKSKSSEVTFKLADPVLNCRNKKKLDIALDSLINKYSHELRISDYRLNNMIAMTKCVDFEGDKINKDMLMIGFVSNSLIYEKREKNEDDTKNND